MPSRYVIGVEYAYDAYGKAKPGTYKARVRLRLFEDAIEFWMETPGSSFDDAAKRALAAAAEQIKLLHEAIAKKQSLQSEMGVGQGQSPPP